jgi:hypothetical protein
MPERAENLRKKLVAARRELDELQRANDRLKSHELASEVGPDQIQSSEGKKPMDALTKATIWLAWLTFMSVAAVFGGTWYTIHADEENKFLPILVLGSRDDYADKENPANTIFIRNIGFGPALNAVTAPFSVGDGMLRLNHRTAIATSDTQDIDAEKKPTGSNTFEDRAQTLGVPAVKRVTLVSEIEAQIKGHTILVCTSYENARRERYETWHEMRPSDRAQNLQINFLCQKKTSTFWADIFGTAAQPCAGGCPENR